MQPNAAHIRQIKVVSNTHWDREFRRSFEQTRRRLLTMLDVTLDILASDPKYHSFTMDGHSIMMDDYTEMRPERMEQIRELVRGGRLILGPWFTLTEQYSLAGEALVRNLLYGRKTVEKYGGKVGTVAYTPASWGQTGQLPQILAGFGLDKMMFYRGISHHEADAEWVWEGADGTRALASRFGIYARYNWYYQVHRPVTSGRVFAKDYVWGEFDEVPLRFADSLAGEDLAFDLKSPAVLYNPKRLKQAIEDMVRREGPHFTTSVFLAMNGHDISVAYPLESKVIEDAKKLLKGKYSIEHTDLEHYWAEVEKRLDKAQLPVLKGERRAYLKQGMWTYLMPSTISARTYLKQQDFDATLRLVAYAEPMASLAAALGAEYPVRYLDRGWRYLLANHTHDANGGCAPDAVCKDIEYRYRKVCDVGDIVVEDAISHIAMNLAPADLPADAMQLVVFNPLPFARNATVAVDVEIPAQCKAQAAALESTADQDPARQPISAEKGGAFVDSIWEVPRILDSRRIKFYARLKKLPALGYRVYRIKPEPSELRATATLVTGTNRMENKHLAVTVNPDGTASLTCKATGRTYENVNFLSDEGETGNAWWHKSPAFDRKYTSLGCPARVAVVESGPLVATIAAEFEFSVPRDYADGTRRSELMVALPVRVEYRLEAGSRALKVALTVDNRAKDHWLRVNFPTGLKADHSTADTHFDVVDRPIAVPDSTGWVEAARGMQPLQTFAALSDGKNGLALLPRGLFEYEVFDDPTRTMALTLIRACRIKLAVSEEKQTELPDAGVQCPGVQRFEYGVCAHEGDWQAADLPRLAAEGNVPVRAVMTGRGRGHLPHECSLFTVAAEGVIVTAVKQAEDGHGMMVRLLNPLQTALTAKLTFLRAVAQAAVCRMDESAVETLVTSGKSVSVDMAPKKIVTVRVQLEKMAAQ